jgi:hypothetical protein
MMATDVQDAQPAEAKQDLKPMKGYQTNCDEKDAKGKPCWGLLKMWSMAPDDIRRRIPAGHVIYRCQVCWQVYHGENHNHMTRGGQSN